jgi:DNA-binding NarL/FixJ family response regulator
MVLMKALTEKQIEALVLHVRGGLNFNQIAIRLNVDRKSIAARVGSAQNNMAVATPREAYEKAVKQGLING